MKRARVFGCFVGVMTALATLGGCGSDTHTSLDDGEQVVRAALILLTADGRLICVDQTTHGQPLALFLAMHDAPAPSRLALGWHPPGPLDPPALGGAGRIRRGEANLGKPGEPALEQGGPGNSDVSNLPPLDQLRLNSAVLSAANMPSQPVTIRSGWQVPRVNARWFVRNWFAEDCNPHYVITNPVLDRGSAFVTVTAGHWGTIYAFEKKAGRWRGSGQWATWLY